MKVKSLKISNIAGIISGEINFNDHFNVLCGYNSTGKTTILECIGHGFFQSNYEHRMVSTNILTRNFSSENGFFELNLSNIDDKMKTIKIDITHFNPTEQDFVKSAISIKTYTINLINLKINRTINYTNLTSISRDPEINDDSINKSIRNGADSDNFKNWFINRFLFSAHNGSLNASQLSNLEFAKRCFSILDNEYKFKSVTPDTYEIILDTPGGQIFFEYLSSGFKACLCILFTIIKEIEYQNENKDLIAEEFEGIILIDEPEIHMHPSWQYKLRNILCSCFPKSQLILATHSPHLIQSCDSNEVIVISNNNGILSVKDSQLQQTNLNFKGWTIEEILTDIMGMEDVRTTDYKKLVSQFYTAIEDDDHLEAGKILCALDKMLHPNSIDRRIFKLDLAMLTGGSND